MSDIENVIVGAFGLCLVAGIVGGVIWVIWVLLTGFTDLVVDESKKLVKKSANEFKEWWRA
jgi:hypothetical protein